MLCRVWWHKCKSITPPTLGFSAKHMIYVFIYKIALFIPECLAQDVYSNYRKYIVAPCIPGILAKQMLKWLRHVPLNFYLNECF